MKLLGSAFFVIGVIAAKTHVSADIGDNDSEIQTARDHRQVHAILVNGGFDVLDRMFDGILIVRKLQGQIPPKIYTIFTRFLAQHMNTIDTIIDIIKKNPKDLDEILQQITQLFRPTDMAHYIKELVRDFPQSFGKDLRLLLLRTFVSVRVSVVTVASKCLSILGLGKNSIISFVKNTLDVATDEVATYIEGPLGRNLIGNQIQVLGIAAANNVDNEGKGLDVSTSLSGQLLDPLDIGKLVLLRDGAEHENGIEGTAKFNQM